MVKSRWIVFENRNQMVYNISIDREAGGTYILSKSEEKAAGFDANMDSISKITFNIGGYHNYIVEITGEVKAYTKLWEDEEPLKMYVEPRSFQQALFLLYLAWCG